MAFFRKKIKAVTNGTIVNLESIPDEVFSNKMMGDGFGIIDHNGQVFSPVNGKVKSIFPTKHAITITSNFGKDILVHMGLDTVELKGIPFSIKVREGDAVKASTLLAVMDLNKIIEEDKNSAVIVVLPDIKNGEQLKTDELVKSGDTVFLV